MCRRETGRLRYAVPLAEQKPDDVGLVHCGETYLLRAARRSAEVLCRYPTAEFIRDWLFASVCMARPVRTYPGFMHILLRSVPDLRRTVEPGSCGVAIQNGAAYATLFRIRHHATQAKPTVLAKYRAAGTRLCFHGPVSAIYAQALSASALFLANEPSQPLSVLVQLNRLVLVLVSNYVLLAQLSLLDLHRRLRIIIRRPRPGPRPGRRSGAG